MGSDDANNRDVVEDLFGQAFGSPAPGPQAEFVDSLRRRLALELEGLSGGVAPVERDGNNVPRIRSGGRYARLLFAAVFGLAGIAVALGIRVNSLQASHSETRQQLDRTRIELRELQREKLVDALDTGWLDPQRWRTGRRKTTAVDGYARLNDRGSLVSVQEFPAPFSIDLDWRWIDIAGDMSYRDVLTIAVHTTGEHAAAHPFQVRDGIEVNFEANAGRVSVTRIGDRTPLAVSAESALAMPQGEWHHVRVIDDGKSLALYLSGPRIAGRADGGPVLAAAYTGTFRADHIAIYNREKVAGALHESHIRNVRVDPPSGSDPK